MIVSAQQGKEVSMKAAQRYSNYVTCPRPPKNLHSTLVAGRPSMTGSGNMGGVDRANRIGRARLCSHHGALSE